MGQPSIRHSELRHPSFPANGVPLPIQISFRDLQFLSEESWTDPANAFDGAVKYFRFELKTQRLPLTTRRVLARFGVDSLEEGGDFEAYGIANPYTFPLERIRELENIVGVEPGEPPCSK